MSNFTPIVNADSRKNDKAIWNDPMTELSDAIGNLTTLTTAAKTSAVAALNEVDANADAIVTKIGTAASSSGTLGTSIDTDGTLKAGAVDGAGVLASNVVTTAKILDANVTNAKLAADAANQSNLVWDAFNESVGVNVSDVWFNPGYLTIEAGVTANPYRGKTLRLGTGGSQAGKWVNIAAQGVQAGDYLSLAVSGETDSSTVWRFYYSFHDSAYVAISANDYVFATGTGAAQVQTQTTIAVPAGTTYLKIFVLRNSGTDVIDVFGMWAIRGVVALSTTQPTTSSRALLAQEVGTARADYTSLSAKISKSANLVWDPFNRLYAPISGVETVDGCQMWFAGASMTAVDSVAANPFGGRSLRIAAASTLGGKFIRLPGQGVKPGDVLTVAISAATAADTTWGLYYSFHDGSGYIGGIAYVSVGAGTGAAQTAKITTIAMPATAQAIVIYVTKTAVSALDIFGMWCSRGEISTTDLEAAFGTALYAGMEIKDARGDFALLADRLTVSIDADGTLKAGAVDGTGVLASNVVTTAKILDANVTNAKLAADAANQSNLVWDAFNESVGVNVSDVWFNPGYLTIEAGVTANPYRGKTLRLGTGGSQAGKWVNIAAQGVQAGDYLSLAVSGETDSSTVWRFYYSFHDSAYVAISANDYVFATGTGAAQVQTQTTIAVPAGTTYLKIFVLRNSGTDVIDVFGMWAIRGVVALSTTQPTTSSRALLAQEVGTARADYTSLSAKISKSANLVWDPFNRLYAPISGVETVDGCQMWFAGASMTAVDSVAANPFGGRSLRIAAASTLGGKFIRLPGQGVKPGDVLTVAISAATAADTTWGLYYSFHDGSGYIGGIAYVSVGAGTGAAQTAKITTIAMPATAQAIVIYVTKTAVSALDIFGMWCSRGEISTTDLEAAFGTALYAGMEIKDARGDFALLADRLTVSINADGTLKSSSPAVAWPAAEVAYGQHLLKNYMAKLAFIRQADTTSQAVVAVVGDSWTHGYRFFLPIKSALQAEYGNAGAGWGTAGDLTETAGGQPDGISRAITGTWTHYDESSGAANAYGADLAHAVSTDDSTPASISWTSAADTIVIHYMKQPTGGTFRYTTDGGSSWSATIDTANATLLHATETITGLGGGSITVKIEVAAAVTAGVIICGVDFRLDGNGVRCLSLGNNGSVTSDWTGIDETIWEAGIAALEPDVVLIILGTNDKAVPITPTATGANLTTLAARIVAARTVGGIVRCDVGFVVPGDRSGSFTYAGQEYADAIRSAAVAAGAAGADGLLSLGAYADADDRGLYADVTHLNAYGGQQLGRMVVRRRWNLSECLVG